MPAQVRFYSDPACAWSWAAEPALRRLLWEFDGELEFVWVMGGLARRYGRGYRDEEGGIGEGPDCFADLISHWLNVAAASEMPMDPRIWTENPLATTYPACQGVKAAAEQGWEACYRYLRVLREGLMFERRKLDLIFQARERTRARSELARGPMRSRTPIAQAGGPGGPIPREPLPDRAIRHAERGGETIKPLCVD